MELIEHDAAGGTVAVPGGPAAVREPADLVTTLVEEDHARVLLAPARQRLRVFLAVEHGSRQTPAPGEHESVATIVVEDLDPMRAYHVHGLVRGRERNEEQDHENERGNARICLQEAQLAPYAV